MQCTDLSSTTENSWFICGARAILKLAIDACSQRCVDSTSSGCVAAEQDWVADLVPSVGLLSEFGAKTRVGMEGLKLSAAVR